MASPSSPVTYEYKPGIWQKVLYLALVLFGIGQVIQAWGVVEVSQVASQIESSAECRFDENAEISDINDRIDLWTARGLAATVRGDDAAVERALENIDDLTDEFEELIATRQTIAESCSRV